MSVPFQTAVAVARNPKVMKLLVALMGALAISLFLVVTVLLSSVGAVASMCQAEAAQTTPTASSSPGGAPEGYVSTEPSDTALADIPENYLEIYRSAAEEYGLDWAVLAAVGKIETDHGRYDAPGVSSGENSSGAGGPMQFLAATWASVGVDGNGDGESDRYDPEDAIPGTANYLSQSGAPQDYQAAIFTYNNAQWYVDDVLAQAEQYRSAEQQEPAAEPQSASGSDSTGGWTPPTGGTEDTPNEYDLVDENRRIDYELQTAYGAQFEEAAANWNDLGGVRLAPSPSPEETDMVVVDAPLPDAGGNTSSDGSLTVDPDVMAFATENARVSLFAHEIGHAEGFEHTEEPSVLNTPVVTNSNENYEAPTPYDVALHNEVWGNEGASGGAASPPPSTDGQGGGGSGDEGEEAAVEGNSQAVFPLPEEYFDSYDDTWGAARGHGGHEGTDLFAPDGTEIYSITSGTVVAVSGADEQGWNELGGWTTMIEASESVGPI